MIKVRLHACVHRILQPLGYSVECQWSSGLNWTFWKCVLHGGSFFLKIFYYRKHQVHLCDLFIIIHSLHLTTSTAPSTVKPPMKGCSRTLKAASKLATCITFLAADACKKMWERNPWEGVKEMSSSLPLSPSLLEGCISPRWGFN